MMVWKENSKQKQQQGKKPGKRTYSGCLRIARKSVELERFQQEVRKLSKNEIKETGRTLSCLSVWASC